MPTLNHVSCTLRLANSLDDAVPEYAITYNDGAVSTYIAIPQHRSWFKIHLDSDGCVAPGLAAFVYVDGTYVGSKNTIGFASRSGKRLRLVFDGFEELAEDGGSVVKRHWWFEEFNVVTGKSGAHLPEEVLQNLGLIEIVVLRCEDPSNASPDRYNVPRGYDDEHRGGYQHSRSQKHGNATRRLGHGHQSSNTAYIDVEGDSDDIYDVPAAYNAHPGFTKVVSKHRKRYLNVQLDGTADSDSTSEDSSIDHHKRRSRRRRYSTSVPNAGIRLPFRFNSVVQPIHQVPITSYPGVPQIPQVPITSPYYQPQPIVMQPSQQVIPQWSSVSSAPYGVPDIGLEDVRMDYRKSPRKYSSHKKSKKAKRRADEDSPGTGESSSPEYTQSSSSDNDGKSTKKKKSKKFSKSKKEKKKAKGKSNAVNDGWDDTANDGWGNETPKAESNKSKKKDKKKGEEENSWGEAPTNASGATAADGNETWGKADSSMANADKKDDDAWGQGESSTANAEKNDSAAWGDSSTANAEKNDSGDWGQGGSSTANAETNDDGWAKGDPSTANAESKENNDSNGWGQESSTANVATNDNDKSGGWGDSSTADAEKKDAGGWGQENTTATETGTGGWGAEASSGEKAAETTSTDQGWGSNEKTSEKKSWETKNDNTEKGTAVSSTPSTKRGKGSGSLTEAINPFFKPYWGNSPNTDGGLRKPLPLYSVPEGSAPKYVTHQVRGGPAKMASPPLVLPVYWDSVKNPYAVFRFKYRTKKNLEAELKIDKVVDPDDWEWYYGTMSMSELLSMVKGKGSQQKESQKKESPKHEGKKERKW